MRELRRTVVLLFILPGLAAIALAIADARPIVVAIAGLTAASLVGLVWTALRSRRIAESLRDRIESTRRELEARADEARRDRESRELILSSMEEGIVLLGSDDYIAYANAGAERLIGSIPDALRNLTPTMLQRLASQARARDAAVDDETDLGNPTRILRASAIPVGDGNVLLVLRDVTEARRVEAVRRDFAANASHELKTPVASIQAAAETIRETMDHDVEAARRFAERLHSDAVRLSRIVSDLLDLSRLESESPIREPVRLDLLANEQIDRFRLPAQEAGIEVDVETAPTTVEGSRRDLSQLIGNLLENAIRYTRKGGRVRLTIDQRDGLAELIVADTGIGIPSRDLPRIFERFYRVDRARARETGGTGLGLSIAKHVAEQHGGRIDVESELGRGSMFRVAFPVHPPSN
ncbi:MAG: ATP-binding protein [Actinomycetota bacterium]